MSQQPPHADRQTDDRHEVHEHDLGLQHDLGTLQRRRLGRRGLLGVVGGLSVAAVATACGGDSAAQTTSTSQSAGTGTASGARGGPPPGAPAGGGMGGDSGVQVDAGEIPEETAGPYPATAPTAPTY